MFFCNPIYQGNDILNLQTLVLCIAEREKKKTIINENLFSFIFHFIYCHIFVDYENKTLSRRKINIQR